MHVITFKQVYSLEFNVFWYMCLILTQGKKANQRTRRTSIHIRFFDQRDL